MPIVAHFVRKKAQLQAPFILNQIIYLNNYDSICFFRTSSEVKSRNTAHFGGLSTGIINNTTYDISLYDNKINKFNRFANYLLFQRHYEKITSLIEKHKVDILHFHYGSDAIIFKSLLRDSKLPKIVSFYGYDCSSFPNAYFGLGRFLLNHFIFKKTSAVIAMSRDMKEDLVKIGCPEEKIIVHYHGADTLKLSNQIKRTYQPKEYIKLLIIGNLVEKKGHLFLLESFKQVIKSRKNVLLDIYGTGPYHAIINQYIKRNQLEKFVFLNGPVNYLSKEMIHAFKNADIFVHPSITTKSGEKEGIPGTLLEAMSTGLPVISTYHAGIPEVIKNNINGFLVEENNVSELRDKIIDLIDNIDLRIKFGINGKNYILNNITIQYRIKNLEKIYNSLNKVQI